MVGATGPANRGTLDVLWLEDDPSFADIAERILEDGSKDPTNNELGLHPRLRRTATLAETLAELTYSVPDLIITDLNLPDSTGTETLLALREAAPLSPLLVLSGTETIEPAILTALENAEFLDKDDLTAQRLWRAVYMAITRSSANLASH